MAKVISVDNLKPLLADVLTEENEASFIEGVMSASVDYDEEAINSRISEAADLAREEARLEYQAKLHDMFFGTQKEADDVVEDDSNIDEVVAPREVEDIFE